MRNVVSDNGTMVTAPLMRFAPPLRVRVSAEESNVAAATGLENATSTVETAVFRGAGVTGPTLTTTGADTPLAQAIDTELLQGVALKSSIPAPLIVNW